MRILVSGGTVTLARLTPLYPDYLGRLTSPASGASADSLESSGLPWAADNGCFGGLDAPAFRSMLTKVTGRNGLLWVACPDVVADAARTLLLFEEWLPQMTGVPKAFVLQDGQELLPVPWRYIDAIFVGGSTRWKLSDAAGDLVAEAKRRGLLAHMGRVNSLRRIRTAQSFGCDTLDGGQFNIYGDVHLEKGIRWLKQAQREQHASLLLW